MGAFLLNCHPMDSFCELVGHVISLWGEISVSRTDDDFFLFSFVFFKLFSFAVCGGLEGGRGVCTFITPSVCSFKNVTVYAGVRVVPACTGTF